MSHHCIDCQHWRRLVANAPRGTCHAHPPAPAVQIPQDDQIAAYDDAKWPQPLEHERCGEFLRKRVGATR